MKKILLLLILVASFFSIGGATVKAQMNDFLVPGVNCGIAGDLKTSKCCAPVDLTSQFNLGSPNFSSLFTIVRDWVMGPGLDFVKTKVNPFVEFQKKILIPCQTGVPSTPSDPSNINCRCTNDGLTPTPGPLQVLNKFCDNQTSSSDQSGCKTCATGGGVWTGIGCVQGSINNFIGQTVFGFGVGLAGGFSLLCVIYAAFMMQSSQGNPEKLKKAQEMITSCIMGLMLIIFSVFILRLIGFNILKIPGFG